MSESIFFTSDTHFGHKNLLHLGRGRPFSSIEEHDEALVDRWNERVQPQDRVYHLGDFAFANRDRTEEILDRLKGQIHFVRGNHDSGMDRFASRFASYQQYKEIRVEGQRIVLFHFPVASWHKAHHGSWHLHGHCHGNFQAPNGPMADVGVDCWDFAPVAYEEIAEALSTKTWTPTDHHVP